MDSSKSNKPAAFDAEEINPEEEIDYIERLELYEQLFAEYARCMGSPPIGIRVVADRSDPVLPAATQPPASRPNQIGSTATRAVYSAQLSGPRTGFPPGRVPYHGNRPERPRENEEELHFRRTILKLFKCPFQEENACRFWTTPDRCLFSHVDQSDALNVGSHLKNVPSYVCIYHLINSCRTTENGGTKTPAATAGTPGPRGQNGRRIPPTPCSNGFHPKLEEMLDLDDFERRHKREIKQFGGLDCNLECGVCLEKVRSKHLSRHRLFAILENCNHCFCFGCIKAWEDQSAINGKIKCPLCVQPTGRIAFRRHFISKVEKKWEIFRGMPE